MCWVLWVGLETLVLREPEDLVDLLEESGSPVQLELRDLLERLDLLVTPVFRENLDSLDSPEVLVQQDRKDFREFRVLKDLKVSMVPVEFRGFLVIQVQLATRELWEQLEILETQDLLDQLDIQVIRDLLV